MSRRQFRVGEFSKLCGVSVRTLHHYDQMGLLQPNGRSSKGYRLYSSDDVARLQQVVTLKFLGLSLGQIKELLKGQRMSVAETLQTQRKVLLERRRQIDDALKAISDAEHSAPEGQDPDWEALAKIVEVIEMQKDYEWVRQYYTEEQLAELATRDSPEVREKAQADWSALIADVEASLGEDPHGARAQALAKRWSDLIFAFTQGNPGIQNGLNSLYADQSNWPASFKRPWSDDVDAFIKKAMAARNDAT